MPVTRNIIMSCAVRTLYGYLWETRVQKSSCQAVYVDRRVVRAEDYGRGACAVPASGE